jgi:copper homeostasis protein
MPVTIHKCIDWVPDIFDAIEGLKKNPGVSGMLSSGKQDTAWEGRELLKHVLIACGDVLSLIVAGRVTQQNLQTLIEAIGAREYHGRNIVRRI